MPSSYKEATNTYAYYLFVQMRDFVQSTRVFTSDYGLYWFDYEAGYSTVLAQFVWNQSRSLSIGLCRGAAEMHNKTWGVMITWKYDNSPYLEKGSELYDDMVTAYDAGANYVVVFNHPQVGDYGVLTQEHLDAFKDFRAYVSSHPQQKMQRTAYVLPEDYGFGFRNPNDSIWGVWKADETAPKIWNQTQQLESIYGDKLDIVYDSLWTRVFWRQHYNNTIWWNATTTRTLNFLAYSQPI